MATMSGGTAASGVFNGWRVYAKYTVSVSDTQVTVSISEAGAYCVGSETDFWFGSSQTFKVGSNTYTAQYYQGSYPETSLREWITLCTNSTLSNYRTWTYTFNKGHADTTKTIAVSMSLGSGWELSRSGTYRSVASTSSSGAITVSVPALESWTVSLDSNGGTGASASLTKYYGETLALPQPAKDGYAFSHWTDGTTNYTTTYTANAAASLEAVYTPVITSAAITQVFAERDDGRFLWDSNTGKHTSAADDGEYVYIRAWWRVDGADAATVSLGASMASSSTTVWTGTGQTVSKPGTGETYLEGVAEWGTSQTALVTGRYTVTTTISAGGQSGTLGAVVPTAFFTMDVLAGGHGVAFGKPATETGLLDVAMDLAVASGSGSSPARAVFHVNDAGTTYLTVYDNTGDPAYRWYWSYAGNLAREDYVGNAWVNTRYYLPNFTAGDSVNLNNYVADGYLTNSRKDCEVCITFPRSLNGVTSASVTGTAIVRQNNAYLFGSTDSTGVDLSGFTRTVTVNSNGFIRFRFSSSTSQTSGVNNSPISVLFQTLTITFS